MTRSVVTDRHRVGQSAAMGCRIASFFVLFGITVACVADGEGDAGGTTEAAQSCEHGEPSECACVDGSMGTQMCKHDGSGFEPCVCPGSDDGSTTATGDPPPPPTDGDDAADDAATTEPVADGSSSGGDSSGGSSQAGSDDVGAGQPPEASIFHPSDGEERTVGVPIPFIGEAADLEDGVLTGASLQWASDVDGPIGQGEMFDAALATEGPHVITLTATDADGNTTTASIGLTLVP